MNESLTLAEKQFLQQVLNELKHEQINSEDRDTIKQQLLEHFQEAHDHGEDSLETIGDPATFVKDFFDVHGIFPHPAIKKNPNSWSIFIIATLTFITTFLTSQFILSLVLTDSFQPQHPNPFFQYNILYNISEHPWWNYMLLAISLSIAFVVSFLVFAFVRKRNVA
ncbi:hypothetical protein [Halalkalibacterium halodurans]|uniref:Uncharacterized protein n=1 Tax=Halalkalibacterium halodurans TaxID=86665 RepID=A0A0M0KCV2_ALKHA|nr:hypothetical protein [Halalkalibacterium halodurans]TPE70060.1 hypothetical protein AMD02_005385 [Halalkalibacterium halodurans]